MHLELYSNRKHCLRFYEDGVLLGGHHCLILKFTLLNMGLEGSYTHWTRHSMFHSLFTLADDGRRYGFRSVVCFI
jgi:hypothetical protein